jgi:hypothetical protein
LQGFEAAKGRDEKTPAHYHGSVASHLHLCTLPQFVKITTGKWYLCLDLIDFGLDDWGPHMIAVCQLAFKELLLRLHDLKDALCCRLHLSHILQIGCKPPRNPARQIKFSKCCFQPGGMQLIVLLVDEAWTLINEVAMSTQLRGD